MPGTAAEFIPDLRCECLRFIAVIALATQECEQGKVYIGLIAVHLLRFSSLIIKSILDLYVFDRPDHGCTCFLSVAPTPCVAVTTGISQ